MTIAEALQRLEYVRNELQLFVPIAGNLHLLDAPEDIVGFVSIAQKRIKSDQEPRRIIEEPESRALDLDEFVPFRRVEEGEFEGCLMDHRHVFGVPGAMEATNRLVLLLSEENHAESTEQEVVDENTNKFATVGMFRCIGYCSLFFDATHVLLFRVPANHKPMPLRRLLVTKGTDMHSIDDRLEFAIKLVTALHIFHCVDMVHKSLRPEGKTVFSERAFLLF